MPAPRWRSDGLLDRTLTPIRGKGSHPCGELTLEAAPSSSARAAARSGAESAAPVAVVDRAPAAFASRTACSTFGLSVGAGGARTVRRNWHSGALSMRNRFPDI